MAKTAAANRNKDANLVLSAEASASSAVDNVAPHAHSQSHTYMYMLNATLTWKAIKPCCMKLPRYL